MKVTVSLACAALCLRRVFAEGEAGVSDHEEGPVPQDAILFIFFALIIGVLARFIAPMVRLPYTVL
jgi:hypothetical protein